MPDQCHIYWWWSNFTNYAFINKQKLHGYFLSVFWTGNMKHGEFLVISSGTYS